MSVQFAGSRSMDERRRRRLAVHGEGTGPDSTELASGEEKPLPDCVPAELCAASPWIPRSLWKLWTLAGLLLAGVGVVAAMRLSTPSFRPELAPALDPLFQSDQPRLMTYLQTIFWTLSGQLALLVGWHRAHSRLDFRGWYRIWPWAAAAMFIAGFCAATQFHASLGTVLYESRLIGLTSPKVAWLAPALGLLIPLWILLDRDVRRSRGTVVLLRASLCCLLGGAGLGLVGQRWIDASLVGTMESIAGLVGPALLMLSLWVQGWYVAYVTPDPPTSTPFRFPRLQWNVLGWLWSLFAALFRRKPDAPPPKRRKKGEEAAAPKRKRRSRRVSKPRTKKVVEEEEADEEQVAEDDAAEEAEEDAGDESETAEAESGEEYDEEELEALTAPTPKTSAAPARPNPSASYVRPPENRSPSGNNWANASHQQHDSEDEDDDEDDDGKMYRIDGPSPDMLKGLSKRQRRELKKQWREQQRAQSRR
jgi:hypothetical protein